MKKYFSKYLPVLGEIKEGDIFEVEKGTYSKLISMINNTCKCLCIHGFKVGQEYTCHAVNLQKKFKLFLCSRDIQIGDKVQRYFKDKLCNPTEVLDMQGDKIKMDGGSFTSIWDDKSLFFKVIGEISREATWIKEGDEFDEDEIKRTYSERYYDPEEEEAYWDTCQLKGTDPDPKPKDSWHFNPIKIKCSNCKSFH